MSAGQLLKQANQLKRAGRLDEAIALYHQAIELNPNFAWTYNNLGDAFVRQAKLDEAVVEYRQAIEINPNSAWFYYQLGEALAQQGKLDIATVYFQKSIEINPGLFDLLIHLSYSQFTVKRKEDLLYIFDNKDSEFLEDEPNWIDFSVMPNTTYSLEGKIASESFPSTENALVQCKFINEKGEVLPPSYAEFSIMETVDSYQYIPINNNNLSKFSIQFTSPHQAVSAKMGFRQWNSRSKIIIASQMKIFSSRLTPQKPNLHFILSRDNFTETLCRQVEQKKHYFKHPPFFIVGSGRCGTTLMRRILQSHSEVIIPDENYTIYKSYKICNQPISWPEKVELIFSQLMSQDSYQHLDLFPLIKCLSKLEGEKQRLDNLWNCFHWFYSKVCNKKVTRWGDKTPLNIIHLDPVISIFPNAKFICLVRNAYDVSASYASMKGREGKVEEGLDRWIKSNFCVFQFLFRHPSSVHFVKYEDLVTNPQAEVQKVCQFISLDFQASMIEKVDTAKTMTDVLLHEHLNNVKKEIFTDSVGKGVKAIPEKMKDELDKKAKMWHDLFGYSF